VGVVLVAVDDRLTTPACDGPSSEGLRSDGLAHLRTDGVEHLVQAVVHSVTDADPAAEPGPTFLGVDPDDRTVVGTCGFLGPARGGRVEIAFWTFPPFEGRGWATAMTRALVTRAFSDPTVHTVVAHTLPERGPASGVLKANGLVRVEARRRDETPDAGGTPVRGQVWRWELLRPHRAVPPEG
jgi:ribosomal-protein-alanine N-acetyltransferase